MQKRLKIIVIVICVALFLLPFFWFSPGELELGGDSNRLFLYSPVSYLQADSLFSVSPDGVGLVRPDQALLPFLMLLSGVSAAVRSPYILMCLLNSLKMMGSFLFIYLFVIEILKPYRGKDRYGYVDISGIFAGIFYTFAPSVGANMHAALLTHNQVFLNPLILYLLLRFLLTTKDIYLWMTLLVTVMFSPNFSLVAPPAPFAFYPLALTFLVLYTAFVQKKIIPWKKIMIGLCLFVGLHAFHIIPVISYVFDSSSYFHTRIMDATSGRNEALDYFNAVLGLGKVSKNLLYAYEDTNVRWTTFAVPIIIVVGLLWSKKIHRSLLLIITFFFLTLFLISANITGIGLDLYRKLFYIPGFGIFRVFYGQWQWVYTFFYSILFGNLIFIVFSRLRPRYVIGLSVMMVGLFVYSSWRFISGDIFQTVHWGSHNMMSVIQMNPQYDQMLTFMKSLPDDGKIITFPFTDHGYQVVAGLNNGAYIGVSPISYLTGRRDFSGYPSIDPYSETFLRLIKEKKYQSIKELFAILNIRYILFNADPKAYTDSFPAFPYSLFSQVVPDEEALADLVRQLAGRKIFEAGDYHVYEMDKVNFLPHFYVKGVTQLANHTPTITYKRINPTKYRLDVFDATEPYALVFSDAFNKDWKLYVRKKDREPLPVRETYLDGSIGESFHENIFYDAKTFETLKMSSIPEKQHFIANKYANAWYIRPQDSNKASQYTVIVEMVQQQYFYYGLGISVISLVAFFVYGISIVVKSIHHAR